MRQVSEIRGWWKVIKTRATAIVLGVSVLAVVTAGCGTLTGAAVGAGSGAAISAGTGGDPGKGALIGAGVGGAAGAIYDLSR